MSSELSGVLCSTFASYVAKAVAAETLYVFKVRSFALLSWGWVRCVIGFLFLAISVGVGLLSVLI